MPKKDGSGDYEMSDYGNWNVASEYSRLKIMRPLYLADEYETIATFGYLDFGEELTLNFNEDVLKIRGFKRLIKTLILIINNSKFAIKGNEKKDLLEYRKELEKFYNVIKVMFKYTYDQRHKTKELKIIAEKYNPALERVLEIKSLINEPLNRYDLIFTHKEEFNPKKAKQHIKEGLVTTG